MDPQDLAFDRPVPLFPLPNVVLFPGATQPLHIFEPRYRLMVRDALGSARVIAMALLREGYEEHYHTNHAETYPVVCVGAIRECLQLPDERYYLNLQGLCRARVLTEDRDGDYRTALLEAVPEPDESIEVDGAASVRNALRNVLSAPAFNEIEQVDELRDLLRPTAPLNRAVDILAFKLVPSDEVETKQRILEETDMLRRGRLLLDEMRAVHEMLAAQQARRAHWPPDEGGN